MATTCCTSPTLSAGGPRLHPARQSNGSLMPGRYRPRRWPWSRNSSETGPVLSPGRRWRSSTGTSEKFRTIPTEWVWQTLRRLPLQLIAISEMAGRLEGKACVITGTGGSMGRAAALTFAREGASVVGCDVAVEPGEETVKLVHAAGGTMVSLQPCHLGDPAECARLVELAVSEFGRIDVLYNLAARFHP